MNNCAADGCQSETKKRSLCNKHYMRLYRTGTTDRPELTVAERFWQKVIKADGCWDWAGAKNAEGYGVLRAAGQVRKAHRISYELTVGAIPEGFVIDHRCRNKSCVKPEHLRPATSKQNVENHSGAYRNSESGVRGVTMDYSTNKWVGYVMHNRINHFAGYFTDIKEAEAAVIALRNQLHTHNDLDRQQQQAS